MSPITTHVLDISRGRPAEGVAVVLHRRNAVDTWIELARGVTNADGRIVAMLADDAALVPGTYQLRFATEAYFSALGIRGFYPEVQVTFQVDNPREHFHIPLLLSPHGYSTYRGS
jgi:5-hydroxyisourate hydrolase